MAPDRVSGMEHMLEDACAGVGVVLALDRLDDIAMLARSPEPALFGAGLPSIALELDVDALDEVDHRLRAAAIEHAVELPVLERPARTVVGERVHLVAQLVQPRERRRIERWAALAHEVGFEHGA